mmetsp:Transcript_7921/g.22221  ORF Transcript_7921/g.22221 Transcript_7921/m.22221 type:complete len:202 (-) Transcript_7921:1188-1793(-)
MSPPAMTTGALYSNRSSPARLGYKSVSTVASQTASVRAHSSHAAMRSSMSAWHDAGHMPGNASLSSLHSLSPPQIMLSIKVSSARSHAVMSSSRRRVARVLLASAFLSARCCGDEDGSTKPNTVGCLYNVTKPSPNWTFETACRTTRDRASHASAPGALFSRAASFASASAFASRSPPFFSLRPDFASGAAATGGVVALSY